LCSEVLAAAVALMLPGLLKINKNGFLEKVYEKALMTELNSRGWSVGNQVPLKVIYKEKMVLDLPEGQWE
jgi:GxxExxY protein